MTLPSLEAISAQLESPNLRDRMVALASIRNVSPQDAVPLIKKVLDDESLQLRSMAIFALGIKQTSESYPILAAILNLRIDKGLSHKVKNRLSRVLPKHQANKW